ncbi:MAG: hypothetical protein WD851_09035 [Pirellulales bacterium]
MRQLSDPLRCQRRPTDWQPLLLAMLPVIRRTLRIAFRHLHRGDREEAIQEATANVCVALARLVKQGRSERAYATVLARFAAAQVSSGRQVATPLNGQEILSRYAQYKQGFHVARLERYCAEDRAWREAVMADTRTPIPDQVWFRIDFPEWLKKLSRRKRRIALALAAGRCPSEVASEFRLSRGRISQLRRELLKSWSAFHGENHSSIVRSPPCAGPLAHGGVE